jgi:hypothetical protein
MHDSTFDTLDLRRIMQQELDRRRLSDEPGDYAYQRESTDWPLRPPP